MPVCDSCGTSAGPARAGQVRDDGHEAVPLTWSTALEEGVRKTYCERCSREHLRAMEAKLDSQWW